MLDYAAIFQKFASKLEIKICSILLIRPWNWEITLLIFVVNKDS